MRAVILMAGMGTRSEQREPHPKVLLRFGHHFDVAGGWVHVAPLAGIGIGLRHGTLGGLTAFLIATSIGAPLFLAWQMLADRRPVGIGPT